jgi:hypothetical protein
VPALEPLTRIVRWVSRAALRLALWSALGGAAIVAVAVWASGADEGGEVAAVVALAAALVA